VTVCYKIKERKKERERERERESERMKENRKVFVELLLRNPKNWLSCRLASFFMRNGVNRFLGSKEKKTFFLLQIFLREKKETFQNKFRK
jgi:hypothetical protein